MSQNNSGFSVDDVLTDNDRAALELYREQLYTNGGNKAAAKRAMYDIHPVAEDLMRIPLTEVENPAWPRARAFGVQMGAMVKAWKRDTNAALRDRNKPRLPLPDDVETAEDNGDEFAPATCDDDNERTNWTQQVRDWFADHDELWATAEELSFFAGWSRNTLNNIRTALRREGYEFLVKNGSTVVVERPAPPDPRAKEIESIRATIAALQAQLDALGGK